MASFNKVMVMGNLTRDVEMRVLPSGSQVASFSLAVNRAWSTDAGERREEVTYVDCVVFGRQAETLVRYTRKGSGLFVEGRLKMEEWDDKRSGEKRRKLGVVVEHFQFVGGGSRQGSAENNAAPSGAPPAPPAMPEGSTRLDDDVPF